MRDVENNTVRPFLEYNTLRLKELVHIHWEEPNKLILIHHELAFRSRKKAQRLKAAVEAQLISISKESFRWPNTAVFSQKEALSKPHWTYQKGMLSFLGYSVGVDGLMKNQRQSILDYAFNEPLPVVQSIEYTKQWGIPVSGARLRKMASSIASFYRSAMRRDKAGCADMSCACQEWIEDLDYLKKKYYIGRFDFTWPSTHT